VTAPLTSRALGLTSGRPALGRLVDCDPDVFAADVWGREPLLSRSDDLPAGFVDLFDDAAVDELVSRRGLRAPFLRVAKDGTTFGDRSFTAGAGVGAGIGDQVSDDKLVGLFAGGATLVLQGLHRVWPPLLDFAQSLAADLGHPVQVNAYVTPPASRGFDDHYDVHDVFVLQVGGDKRWRIHRPVHPAPLRDQPWTDHRSAVAQEAQAEPLLDAVLRPGDCLYLPRGYLHAATALGGVSTHVTIGVHTWTRFSLAEQLVAEALAQLCADPAVRSSLGLGAALGDPGATADDLELVRSRLLDAVTQVRAEDVAGRLAERARGAQRAAPVGPLAQLQAASTLRHSDTLSMRPHLAASLVEAPDGGTTLRSRAGDVPLEPAEAAVVRLLLDGETATAADLGADLTRRLLAAAVLVVEPR